MNSPTANLPSRADVERAYSVISPFIRQTPVLTVAGRDLDLAIESVTQARDPPTGRLLQDSGRLYQPPHAPDSASWCGSGIRRQPRGLVACAAGILGIPARIFVPATAAPLKLDRIRQAGAQVESEGAGYAEALARSEVWTRGSGALAIHAFDQPETICGQGTLALEISAQVPDVDTVLVAVGGGGCSRGSRRGTAGRGGSLASNPSGHLL